jgi:eukaryotic-like serine/threonine-protein kinase
MTPDLIAGRYRVVRPVGRGGMGTVWLCQDEVLGREVAVKQIGTLPGESATDAARALREARSSAALNHRNVVAVFDVVDTEDGKAWLVMEYVPSRTLGQIMREEGPLPPRRAAFIGAQVADGLAAAHAAGTMHRDVKPGNILVTDGDVAKISDFGIARGAEDDQLTRTGLVTGTPSYFSPELARGADPGPESDVYALGATLYATVEGRPPYPEQRNPIALLQLIAAEEPPTPTRAGPLAGPITRMMDRDPHSRWTMADSAHALRRFAEHGETGDEHTAVLAPVADGGPERTEASRVPTAGAGSAGGAAAEGGRRRRLVPWLAAAAVLLVVLLAGFMMLADDADEAPQAGAPATSPTPTTSPTREASPTPEASPSPTPTAEETPTQQPARDEDPGDAMEGAVQEYFSVMPGDTDAGWERLAPSMQSQGRDAYESWWGSIESVELHGTDAVDGSQQVDIDLTYYFKDGRATRETQRLTLERSGERYLIADDEVLSSRTVS